MVVTNNAIDNTIGNTNSGITNTFTVQNLSNTASSQAQINTTVAGTSAGDCWNQFTVGATRSWAYGVDNSVSQTLKLNTTNAATITPSSGTNVWKMTTGGIRQMPLQPFIIVGNLAAINNVTGDGTAYTIVFPNSFVDQNSNYNTGTGQFTAPVTGNYCVSLLYEIEDINAAHTNGQMDIYVNGVFQYHLMIVNLANVSTGGFYVNVGTFYPVFTAGDLVTIVLTVTGGTKTIDLGACNLCIYLVY